MAEIRNIKPPQPVSPIRPAAPISSNKGKKRCPVPKVEDTSEQNDKTGRGERARIDEYA